MAEHITIDYEEYLGTYSGTICQMHRFLCQCAHLEGTPVPDGSDLPPLKKSKVHYGHQGGAHTDHIVPHVNALSLFWPSYLSGLGHHQWVVWPTMARNANPIISHQSAKSALPSSCPFLHRIAKNCIQTKLLADILEKKPTPA